MLRVSACFQDCSSCAEEGDPASVSAKRVIWTYKVDVNSASWEIWKEPSSSTLSTETACNSNSKEESFNVNKTFWQ